MQIVLRNGLYFQYLMRIIIIISLILVSLGSKTEFEGQIERLENTQFGKTLLQTIFMQLQTEDPLANLIQMMQNLDAQLEAESRRDDDRQQRIDASCEAVEIIKNNIGQDLSTLQTIIGQATTTSTGLKSELDQLNPQKTAAVANLNRKNAEIVQYQDLNSELNDQTTKREEENKYYLQVLDDLEGALFGVNSVKTYFNNYLDKLEKDRKQFNRDTPEESSFLQKNHKFVEEDSDDDEEYVRSNDSKSVLSLAQISNKINKIKHQVKLEGYRAMVQILSQLTAEMNQENPSDAEILTKKVLVVLKQIEAFIQKQRLGEEQAEEQRVEAFEELKTVYTEQIIDANSERVAMEGLIESLASKITSGSNEKFEVDNKIHVKGQEKNDRELECLTSRQEYETEAAKRNAQKQALQLALDLITSKLGQLKKQLLEKGGD